MAAHPGAAHPCRDAAVAFTTDLLATVLATRCSASITIELAVGVQIVSFEIAIHALAARARGTTSRSGLDDDQRSLFFRGNLRGRQPGLLQRGILAEQRFLQRPSHTRSLQSVKFLAPSGSVSIAAEPPRA